MAKYDERFKLRLVRQYLAGRCGVRAIAAKHDVKHRLLARWVASYRQNGLDGLRKKHSGPYTAEFKLKVLQHKRQEGLSGEQAAALFDIRSPGCIGDWERRYHSGGVDALSPRPRGRPKTMPQATPPKPVTDTPADDERSRKDLLKEIEYLRAEVAYLKKWNALVQAKKTAARKRRG